MIRDFTVPRRRPFGLPMTPEELFDAGEDSEAERVRPRRGSSGGRSPGPWVAAGLMVQSGKAKIWRGLTREDAVAAQNNITNKRRRDGKDDRARWITPIWANIEPESDGTYQLIIVNDPDREAHDAME